MDSKLQLNSHTLEAASPTFLVLSLDSASPPHGADVTLSFRERLVNSDLYSHSSDHTCWLLIG